jgi:phage terminase large subunit GpA-like protein
MMTSARVGKTQAINNLVGYHIHQDPAPILVVLPTTAAAEEWSKEELAPMLRDSPALRRKVAAVRSRDSANTILHKQFPGGKLFIVGANAPSGLRAKTVRVVCCDEVDGYPHSAGNEGDPVSLAIKRATTMWNRKIVLASTPTIRGASRIEEAYNESDRRRFWVPCPHCGEAQTLKWAQVRWEAGDTTTAAYHCEACGAAWDDGARWKAIETAEANGGGWRGEGIFAGVAGFHLSELYSSWRRLSETAREFADVQGNPERLKTWVNTALGETWQERGDAPDWERLLERAEDYPENWAPADALAVTGGVDVQGARVELYLWAWGRGMTSRLVGREVFDGDPSQPEVWQALRDRLDKPVQRDGGGSLRVLRCGVDTGYNTAAVYAQLRRLHDPRILPLKGADRMGATVPITGPTSVDVTERGAKVRGGLKLWTLSASQLKGELYRRLWLSRSDEGFPPGWVHLPKWAPVEALKQLVAEQLVTVKDKHGRHRQEWRPLRERNEALDCAVYARAALWIAGADRHGDLFWQTLEAEHEAVELATRPTTIPNTSVIDAEKPIERRESWLNGRSNRWAR